MPKPPATSPSHDSALRVGAAYIRVSTDEQMELSPDSQLKEIQRYAAAHGIVVTGEHIFMEEEGRSGRSSSRRPQFQRMIGAAKQQQPPFEVILVWRFSRFARNQEESIVYKSMLRSKCGVDVVSISEPLIEGPFGGLVERVIEWMDEYYSIRLSEEVLRGMTEKHQRGGVVSVPPFGYLVEDGVFVPDPDRAPIVRRVFEDFAGQNLGYKQISDRLNALGIRTKRGGPMSNRAVYYMLTNPTYTGKLRWSPGKKGWDSIAMNQSVVDGKHQPLIPPNLWEATQTRVEDIRRKYPAHARMKQDAAMLQGLVRCANCGSTLVRSNKGLQCHSYAHGICNQSHYISLPTINELVLSGLEDSFASERLTILPRSLPQPAGPAQDIAALQKRELQKLERVRMAYEEGIDTLEEYRAKKQRIQATLDHLESSRPPAPQPPTVKQYIQERASLLKELRNPTITDPEKNEILRSFVDHITFYRSTGSVDIFCYG